MLCASLLMACSNDIEISVATPDNEVQMVDITIMASHDDSTRAMLDGNRAEWEVGDSITVALTSNTTKYYTFTIASSKDITEDGKMAHFTGSLPVGSYSNVVALYPAITDGSSATLSRHDDVVYMAATHDGALTISNTSASLSLSFSHLMHKVDYNLTCETGYMATDISHDIGIEMVAKSNQEVVTLPQCYSFSLAEGYMDMVQATSSSHIADFATHNFATEPVASLLLFPTTIEDAELEFNIYAEGRKAHTITKSLGRDITMSAGKTTTVNLQLGEDNRCVEEDTTTGGAVSDFTPDYYIHTLKSGVSGVSLNYGIGYRAYMESGHFDIHIPAKYASTSSINEGEYTWTGTSWVGYNSFQDFTTRNIPSIFGLTSTASLSNSSKMSVAKSGDSYTIDITLVDKNGKSVKVQYIGELNVDNGGQMGGGSGSGSSGANREITLTMLTQQGNALSGSSASGDSITLSVNSIDGIGAGYYEHTTTSNNNHKGYFNISNVKVGGATKSVKSAILYLAEGGSATTMHAEITFDDGTMRHFAYEGIVDTPAVEGEITLSASKSSIVGNGVDKVTFKVVQDGKDVTSASDIYLNGTAIASSYTSTTPGTYTLYATKGTKHSNNITLTVTEYTPSQLTITTSKEEIVADGSDSVTFTVKGDGSIDLTNKCYIYVNGTKLSGNTYRTSSAGTYSAYAKYNSVTSNTISLRAIASDKSIVFADGVTLTSGWYDVNKMKDGNNGDTMMCWAAAASNMIQWWQDRYVAAGNTLPSGAVTGVGTKMHTGTGFSRCYELALMDVFHSQWTNLERGSQSDYAIAWYFEGKLNGGEYAQNQAKPTTSGGYFSSVWSSIYPRLYHDYKDQVLPSLCYDLYTVCFNYYNLWGSKQGNEALAEFSNYVVTSIKRGVASLSIQPGSSLLHAITLWGYEVDNATGLVTRIWVTDSDDQITEPKTAELNEYKVSVNGNKIKLNGTTRYGECTVIDIIPLSGYGSAE